MQSIFRSASMCLVVILATGCAQSGSREMAGGLAAPSSLQAKPGATYDATGAWFAVVTLGEDEGFGTLNVVQDAEGNLTATGDGDPGTYTFTRLGGAATINYRLSITSPDPDGPECGRNLSGTAQLDTRTNTITARRLTGVIDDCSTVTLSITMTKL